MNRRNFFGSILTVPVAAGRTSNKKDPRIEVIKIEKPSLVSVGPYRDGYLYCAADGKPRGLRVQARIGPQCKWFGAIYNNYLSVSEIVIIQAGNFVIRGEVIGFSMTLPMREMDMVEFTVIGEFIYP